MSMQGASKVFKNNYGTRYLLGKSEPSRFPNFNTVNRKKMDLRRNRTLTLADAEATEPTAVMPRLAAMSLLDVVTATVTGVGSSDGITGRGRSPGRLLPLTTAEAQL